jgi:hypothetical protein
VSWPSIAVPTIQPAAIRRSSHTVTSPPEAELRDRRLFAGSARAPRHPVPAPEPAVLCGLGLGITFALVSFDRPAAIQLELLAAHRAVHQQRTDWASRPPYRFERSVVVRAYHEVHPCRISSDGCHEGTPAPSITARSAAEECVRPHPFRDNPKRGGSGATPPAGYQPPAIAWTVGHADHRQQGCRFQAGAFTTEDEARKLLSQPAPTAVPADVRPQFSCVLPRCS